MRSVFQRVLMLNERSLFGILFSLLYGYLWLRAFEVPAFHDEIATFYHYIQSGRFLPYISDWDANNHFLNSALSWLTYSIFGAELWSLRLPNLLIAPLLFLAVYKIGQEIQDKSLRIIWVVAVCLNHFFIEYSALARGYGMSMAFILMAVWFTFRVIQSNKTGFYIGAGLMGTFALLSNLTLIYSVLILLFLLVLIAIIRNHENFRAFFTRLGLLAIFGFAPALWTVSYLFELKSRALLYYGVEGGFWDVTVKTLVFNSVNSQSLLSAYVALLLFIVVVVAVGVTFIRARRLDDILSADFVLYYLLLGNMSLFVMQHHLLGLKYPEDRIGLFLIPFFVGSVCFAADRLRVDFSRSWIRFLTLPLLYFPLSFLMTINLTHITYWENMGIPARFYETIDAASPDGEMPPVVGGHRVKRSLFWAYENYLDGGRHNLMHYAYSAETTDDYLIVDITENPGWKSNYNIIDHDELRDIDLLQRKTKARRVPLAFIPDVSTGDTLDQKYYQLISGSLDTLADKDLFFNWDMDFFSPEKPYRGAVVLDIRDVNDNSIYYHAYKLFQQRKNWDGSPHNAMNGIKYSGVPASAKYFNLYIWNIEDQPYFIGQGQAMVTLFEP